MKFERIIINFSERCNMQCPFCYVPFDGEKTDFKKLEQVLERCVELGISIVTFGGGDPFIYRQFPEILKLAQEKDFQIHVDTNAIGIKEQDIESLLATTKLIGLPLDGSTEEINQNMRCSPRNNFKDVLKLVDRLGSEPITIKINTVASKKNSQDLQNLYKLLTQLPIDVWSLYQYWPLGTSEEINKQYSIQDTEFDNIVDIIWDKNPEFKFEPGSLRERHATYLLVSPNGRLYINDPVDKTDYIFLGSIFDKEWIGEYEASIQTSLRERARHRYRVEQPNEC